MKYKFKLYFSSGFILFISSLLLVWPTLIGRYPLIWDDTISYALAERNLYSPPVRSVFYFFWISLTSLSNHLQFVALAQAIFTAFVFRTALRGFGFKRNLLFLLLMIIFSVATGLPWVVSEILPDFSTVTMSLCLFIVIFRLQQYKKYHQILLLFSLIGSSLLHYGNILILFLMLLIISSFVFFKKFQPNLQKSNLFTAFVAVLTSVVLLMFWNYNQKRQLFPLHGNAWLISRLVKDGIVSRLLEEHCNENKYTFCLYKQDFKSLKYYDSYIWDKNNSPFYKLGAWQSNDRENQRVIKDCFFYYPWLNIKLALKNTWNLLVFFPTSELLIQPSEDIFQFIKNAYPTDYSKFLNSWQVKGIELDTCRKFNFFHHVFGWISLFLCFFILFQKSLPPLLKIFAFYVWAFLVANALVFSNLSGVFSRYEARLTSLPVFLVCLYLFDRFSEKNNNPSLKSNSLERSVM